MSCGPLDFLTNMSSDWPRLAVVNKTVKWPGSMTVGGHGETGVVIDIFLSEVLLTNTYTYQVVLITAPCGLFYYFQYDRFSCYFLVYSRLVRCCPVSWLVCLCRGSIT